MRIPSIIDLTHTFTKGMPVYPGDAQSSLRESSSIERDGYTDHILTTGMHVGTHIDAPAHMIADGAMISDISPERFSGRGVLVDTRGAKAIEQLNNATIAESAIVLFYTGWGEKFRSSEYFTDFPVMTEAYAEELVKRKVKLVGMDTPSPDRTPFAVHKILLGAGVLIIENLTNLEQLIGKRFFVQAFPLKLAADAAPARVTALVD